jgi:hypothetical protein
MAIHLVIAVAKRMPVILDERRRHGWIAEARVVAGIGRRSFGNITLCGFDTIMVTLFGSLGICRRRRGVVRGRLRMRASGKCNGKQQCCHREQFLHDISLVCRAADWARLSEEGTPAWVQRLRAGVKKEDRRGYCWTVFLAKTVH